MPISGAANPKNQRVCRRKICRSTVRETYAAGRYGASRFVKKPPPAL
ncbi:hypothetical protein BRYFOR_06967 [Marvinbryantia formatexigens DSM 14469]|uniref:Uncharacterized protein n=1 Tax=Marvinbryantia formatexigens DSM 14469 TaxID=478749 RepID=C6LEB8_9FIRM|nr:hypothetical protein BRYFOR_06967 [Marvinbryantia formatexigens DSM 14469]